MYGEFSRDDAPGSEPLPPARTRWAEEAGTGPGTSESLLGPVRSGLTGSQAAPVHGFVMGDGSDDGLDLVFESDEIEILVEPDDIELLVEPVVTELDLSDDEPIDVDRTQEIPADTVQIPAIPIEQETRPQDDRPTLLSAWDLASHSGDAEERARRAREEWDNLERALVRSLGSTSADSSVQADAAGPDEIPTELEELARRLEQFAAALRADGTRAMEMAQSRGDPIDVVLAALAAGYVSGRRE